MDHTPAIPSEVKRVTDVGGFISSDRRVNGVLSVTRAFGDFFLHPMVTAEPFINCFDIVEGFFPCSAY